MTRVMKRHFVLNQMTLVCRSFVTGKNYHLRLFRQKMTISKLIYSNIIWLSLVHGGITSLFSVVDNFYSGPGHTTLTLRINELKCNPSLLLTKCVLSELFSWVSIL